MIAGVLQIAPDYLSFRMIEARQPGQAAGLQSKRYEHDSTLGVTPH
jgi:hypothetical protein